ncbi:hypothetical protein F4680DRAFT_427969 [Xylaria scruposa]|nr:hypothetical protein F4680DRAFT_427969 [Xylaria scruposa]
MSTISRLERSERRLSSLIFSELAASKSTVGSDEHQPPRQTNTPDTFPNSSRELDFMGVLNLSTELRLPSLELRAAELVDSETEQKTIVLGSGLTSNVIQYVIPEDHPIETDAGKVVALKTFTRQSSTNLARQEVYESIMNEMEVLRHASIVGHPNIVQLHFIGWRKGEVFPGLAMEHSAHGSLDYLIRSSWAGLADHQIKMICRHITIDIAMGLYAIHRVGYIHGDLKPENILVMSHDSEVRQVVAKLTDFGGSSQSTAQGSRQPVHYTPLWSAPEVLNKDPDIDWERADVYSYGLVVGSLLASVRGNGGFGAGRLSKPSSCFLTAYIHTNMSEQDEDGMLWYMKTNPETESVQSVASLLKEKLEISITDNDDRLQLLQILIPTLGSYFWTRPSMRDVGYSLQYLGESIGRNIREEMSRAPKGDLRSSVRPKLGPFSWTRSRDYFSILVEQATLALDDRQLSDRDLVHQSDIPEVLEGDDDPGKYLKRIADIIKQLAIGNDYRESAEETETRFASKRRRAALSQFVALSSLAVTKSQSNLKTLQDMTYTSAMAGDGAAICFATSMFNNTHTETKFPIRCFLALLTLSHSYHAAQILHKRWPRHYKMVQEMIKLKPSAFEKSKTQIDPNSSPFMLETMTTYAKEPILKRSLTLKEALNMGILQIVHEVLDGALIPDDFDESVPGLLHGISSLPDTEAATLVQRAFHIGGKLSFLAPTISPITGGNFFERDSAEEKPLSPLSAAIRRGKPQLALKIIWLHTQSEDEPILDYDEALTLSCTYLQYETADCLLRLYRDKPQLCHGAERMRMGPESLFSELLLNIMTPEISPVSELERRLLFGPEYQKAYENTLEFLLENGASITDGSISTNGLMNALRLDDMIAVMIFTRTLENRGLDILQHLKDPGNLRHDPVIDRIDITALDICIFSGSIQSFRYLIQKFPSLSSEVSDESGNTLLHEACYRVESFLFVEALLQCGADASQKNKRGQTPIFRALSKGNIEAADIISRHCSAKKLQGILSKSDDEWSVCFQLLVAWSSTRRPGVFKGFQWLAKHGGIHPYGPSGVPAWYPIVGQPRPHASADQRLHAELVALFLRSDGFQTETERWEGKSLLHHAAWNGHIMVVKMLLDKNIDPNIGVDYSGEIPQDLPLHLFDPRKDSLTALDMVCLKLGGLSMPSEIANGGFIEVQKWTDDLEQIRGLLIEKGGKSILFDCIKRVVMGDPHAAESSRFFSNASLMYGQAMTGTWPIPVTEMSKPVAPKTTKEDILADAGMRDKVFHNIMRSQFQHTERTRRIQQEKDATPENYLQQIRAASNLRRCEWRLPPDWKCLTLNEDEDEPGGFRVMYMNRITGECTYKRPKLYRGESKSGSNTTEQDDIPHDTYNTTVSKTTSEVSPSMSPDLAALSIDDTISISVPDPEAQKRSSNTGQSPTATPNSADSDFVTVVTKKGLIQLPRDYTRMRLEDGSNWLHMAAIAGKSDFVATILKENSIPIDSERHDGCTPLHAAVDEGALDVLRLLLTHGADPNRVFPDRGHRPIHHSLLQDTTDMAKTLIEAGADVNAKTTEGYSPLHFCMAVGDKPEFIDLLLSADADVNATCPEGSVLNMAVKNGREESVARLLAAGAHAEEDEHLLHAAARNPNLRIAELLLDVGGLDVNKRTESSWTPIIDAVVYEQFEMLRLLCLRGADISVLAEEFQFFVRRRDDGKIDRMAMHVGQGNHLSVEALNEGLSKENRGWEDWEPVRITKVADEEDKDPEETSAHE